MVHGVLNGRNTLKVGAVKLAVKAWLPDRFLTQMVSQVGQQGSHQIEGGYTLPLGGGNELLPQTAVQYIDLRQIIRVLRGDPRGQNRQQNNYTENGQGDF